MGSIMSSEPELRPRAKEIGPLSGKIVAQVNALSPEEQKAKMEELGVAVEEKKQKKEEGLPKLPGKNKDVVMRFAPNPSGPLHIGHARAAIPNGEYVTPFRFSSLAPQPTPLPPPTADGHGHWELGKTLSFKYRTHGHSATLPGFYEEFYVQTVAVI